MSHRRAHRKASEGQASADSQMKFVAARPYADPDVAARKLVEIANAVEVAQEGRIHIEKINGPTLFQLKATPAE